MTTDTPTKTPRPKRTYTLEDEEAAILALVVCNGSTREANRMLAEQGYDIPEATLRGWRNSKAERIAEVRKGKATHLQERLLEQFDEGIRGSHSAFMDALDLEHRRIKAGKVKDASASMQRIATSIAIMVDKVRLMRSQPTEIISNQSGDDVLAEKLAEFKDLFIEGTAEEVKPAQIEASAETEGDPK